MATVAILGTLATLNLQLADLIIRETEISPLKWSVSYRKKGAERFSRAILQSNLAGVQEPNTLPYELINLSSVPRYAVCGKVSASFHPSNCVKFSAFWKRSKPDIGEPKCRHPRTAARSRLSLPKQSESLSMPAD